MATNISKKYRIQQLQEDNSLLTLHPETVADNVIYDNIESGLTATNVKKAVDELNTKIADVQEQVNGVTGGDVVTGVKGSAESVYRKGNVEITPANIGLGTVTSDIEALQNAVNTTIPNTYAKKTEVEETYATKTELSGVSTEVAKKADKATTLAGYGITDAHTKTEVDGFVSGLDTRVSANRTDITELQNTIVGLTGAMHFLGSTGDLISDGATTNPVTIDGKAVTAVKGDVILASGFEFVWVGTRWEQLGQEGSFVLKTTTINGHALSDNVTLDSEDIARAGGKTVEESLVEVEESVASKAAQSDLTALQGVVEGKMAKATGTADGDIAVMDGNGGVKSAGITVTGFNNKADKATTLAGYGITDAYTKTEVNTEVGKATTAAGAAQTAADNAQTTANEAKTAAQTNATNLGKVVDGTTPVAKANKLTNAVTISVGGELSGSAEFDGSNNVTINVQHTATGVTAGSYTAVTVDNAGRVTAGGKSIAVGTETNNSAPADLAVGGLFFEYIA